MKYTGVVETATIALVDETAKEYNAAGITYTLTNANDGWALTGKVYSDPNYSVQDKNATVTISGDTLTLNGATDPMDLDDELTAYVEVTATKDGQANTTERLILKYKKAEN